MRDEAQTVWESRLESRVITKPKFVVNHYTGDMEIFVQDDRHNVYLLNNSGRVLWKQKIDGQILSDIYQIDYYKNGKLQFLFNTGEQLHLLDRNGNYVERYPVKLRSPATNGLALFDYEKNRDYRIFLAAEDKGVYLYDKEGSIVKGWSIPSGIFG
jgi:outer membrane protein assembly factor BamB